MYGFYVFTPDGVDGVDGVESLINQQIKQTLYEPIKHLLHTRTCRSNHSFHR